MIKPNTMSSSHSQSLPSSKDKNSKTNFPLTKIFRNQKKAKLAIFEEQVALEIANAEIKTLKTKLKEQETSLKDVKFQNSVLLERIATLDKTQQQSMFSSYFPGQKASEPPPSGCSNQSHGCQLAHHCHSCRPTNRCESFSQSLSDISKKLDIIVKSCVPSNVGISQPCGQTLVSEQKENNISSNISNQSPPRSESVQMAERSSDSDSFISIDNFMPDHDEELSLNSKALTSR